jgi:hypothetical protein
MIDLQNPSMICCDYDFSYAIECKVLHQSQLPYFILKQLLAVSNLVGPNVVLEINTHHQ